MSSAQNECWTIKLNGTVLLSAEREDQIKNKKTIRSAEWNKPGNLDIKFIATGAAPWIPAIYLTDELENLVWKKDSVVSASIPLSSLRSLIKGKKELKIYLIKSPPNEMMGRPTQMLHLCTLKLP